MPRSLVDSILFILGLVPSNTNFEEIKENINDIPLSKISSVLLNHHFQSSQNRDQLIKKLVDETQDMIFSEIKDSDDLWERLQYCGSGLSKKLFNNIKIDGTHRPTFKILKNSTYSKKFLKNFENLWKRDKALRRLEWKLLKIGRLYNRDKIILHMTEETTEHILKPDTNLIDVISIEDEILTHSIGKALIYKAKHDPNIKHKIYKLFIKWLDLDPIHCVVILGNSLRKSGEYSSAKLLERFQTRIKSDKTLTKMIH